VAACTNFFQTLLHCMGPFLFQSGFSTSDRPTDPVKAQKHSSASTRRHGLSCLFSVPCRCLFHALLESVRRRVIPDDRRIASLRTFVSPARISPPWYGSSLLPSLSVPSTHIFFRPKPRSKPFRFPRRPHNFPTSIAPLWE
jgi:hypothetical protein